MRRFLAVTTLVLLMAATGCKNIDPNVVKGGGEKVTLDPTGLITAEGHVVNNGNARANDVRLHFSFFQAGVVYFEQDVYLGTVSAGELETFDVTFYGPPADVAKFSWDYTIDWD